MPLLLRAESPTPLNHLSIHLIGDGDPSRSIAPRRPCFSTKPGVALEPVEVFDRTDTCSFVALRPGVFSESRRRYHFASVSDGSRRFYDRACTL